MRVFTFRMFTRVNSNGQEFRVGTVKVTAKDYDSAQKEFSRKDLPFHSFATVESEKV